MFSILDTVKTTKKLDSGVYKLNYFPYPKDKVVVTKDDNTESNNVHEFSDKQKIDDLFKCFF
jgi:hypothetical protein